ncbi:argininosuccinate synthase [archaeon]|jgi:argininosuccinate synthase|nr:argininosuccinate synthase [archaeon]MBT4351244.1 argininosuccinate synthase [archaeon]MBT4648130.1 argininosuccinate synthase [archaeon]MBT6822452.1 argininosuccinate synthase [archaeon]MBT7392098.1 argininosuccinate synthase [archaeon]
MENINYAKISSYEGKMGEVKKVVLLYSGGLDTSCILKWIQDKYKAEVITLTMDLGQQVDDLKKIKAKALKLGALKAYVVDAKDEFADKYLSKMIKANGTYQEDYYISTISRYIMAEKAIEIAKLEGADCIAHGCTGKGNDQVRIEATAISMNPKIKIIAPVREWAMGREKEIKYAKEHGIEVVQKEDFPYSSDDNMWGVTWESGEIEDNNEIPKIEKFLTVNQIKDTPDEPEILELGFKKGVPVSINGEKMKLSTLIQKLNKIGALHGIGVKYMIEDRLVGLKIRGVYEHPGAEIIMKAHKKIELFVSTRTQNEFKKTIDHKWAHMCYSALWMDPLMDDLNVFCDNVNQKVTGTTKLKLFKGNVDVVALDSPYALYDKNLVTFNTDNTFNQNWSPSFIEIYSQQMKMAQQIKNKVNEKTESKSVEVEKSLLEESQNIAEKVII